MRLNQPAALKLGFGALLAAPLMFVAGGYFHEAKLAAQATSSGPARLPLVDEYYPVKNDWISTDRSILTIKHQPTGSCYILLHPAGDQLMPVDKERCNPAPAER